MEELGIDKRSLHYWISLMTFVEQIANPIARLGGFALWYQSP